VISGPYGLQFENNGGPSGTDTLSGTNTYSGGSTIAGGTLSISADNNLGTAPSTATPGQLVVSGGTTLQATASFTLSSNRGIALGPTSGSGSGSIDVTSDKTLTYAGIIANNGSSTGTLVKPDSGTLVLAGANTYSGGTTISDGTLSISADSNLGTTPGSATPGQGIQTGLRLPVHLDFQQLPGRLGGQASADRFQGPIQYSSRGTSAGCRGRG
jgi:autotransporter-associated beta strand protein